MCLVKSRYDIIKRQKTNNNHKSIWKILNNIGIAKTITIYSDQGSEFKNKTFQNLLDKHNIQIFALGHAPFVESFNKTFKNRMMKYMKLKNTDNWSKKWLLYKMHIIIIHIQ